MDKSSDPDLFYSQAFSRNAGLISNEDQEKLKKCRVAIVGMGGVGGIYLTSLARLGVGNFTIADSDSFETVNINRQTGATVHSIGKSKADTMEKMAKSINPHAHIKVFNEFISHHNIGAFLEGVDVVLDGIDFFNIEDRMVLFKKAREMGIPAITSAPIGFGASILTFDPKGMSFDTYFDIRDTMSEEEKLISFGLGISPSLVHRSYYKTKTVNIKDKKAPSSCAGTLLCANLVSCEIYKIVCGKKYRRVPESSQFDPYVRKYKKVIMWRLGRNFFHRLKRWYVLRSKLK